MDAEVPEHVLSDPSYVLLRVGVKPVSGDDRTSLSSITGLHLSLHNQPGNADRLSPAMPGALSFLLSFRPSFLPFFLLFLSYAFFLFPPSTRADLWFTGPVSSTFVARLMDWLASPVASVCLTPRSRSDV